MIYSQFAPYTSVSDTILIGEESVVGSLLKTGGQAPSLNSEMSRSSSELVTLIEMNLVQNDWAAHVISCVQMFTFSYTQINHSFTGYSVLGYVRGLEGIKMNTTQFLS